MTTRKGLPEGKGDDNALHVAMRDLAVAPVQSSRYKRFIAGELPVEELTMQELTKGQLMDRDGGWKGRPPEKIPHKYNAIILRELTSRMNQQFRTHAVDAIDTIADVMNNGEDVRHQKRLDAAKYVVERIIGKIPDRLEVTENITVWQGLQEGDGLLVDLEDDEMEAEIVSETPAPAPRRKSARTARRFPDSVE